MRRSPLSAQDLGNNRQENERQNHCQVLDDQPADCHPSIRRVDQIAFLQRLQENNGAGHGNAEPENQPRAEIPAPERTQANAKKGCQDDLADGPGIATPRTAMRSAAEKCRPTPNIKRMTPISASWVASAVSAVNPGVKGPIRMPANRYPTNGGRRSRSAKITAGRRENEADCDSCHQCHIVMHALTPRLLFVCQSDLLAS
jgi:hypothetical protein